MRVIEVSERDAVRPYYHDPSGCLLLVPVLIDGSRAIPYSQWHALLRYLSLTDYEVEPLEYPLDQAYNPVIESYLWVPVSASIFDDDDDW